VRSAIVGERITAIPTGIGRNGDELDQLFHGRLVDQALDFGDALGMERADIRAMRVDEVQHNNLAAEISKADRTPRRVLQREIRRRLVDRLKVFLPTAKLGFKFMQRMGISGRQQRSKRQDKEKTLRRFRPHTLGSQY
jgi:hypothetical protein